MKYQLIEGLRNKSGVIKRAMDGGWDIPELSEALEGTRDILIDINPNEAKQILCDVINVLSERDLNYLISWLFTRGHIEDNDALAPALEGFYEGMAEMFLGESVDRRAVELLHEAQKLYDIRAQARDEGDDEDSDLEQRLHNLIGTVTELTGMTVEPDERGVLQVVDPTDKEESE